MPPEEKQSLEEQLQEKEKALVQREQQLKEKEALIKALAERNINSENDFTNFTSAVTKVYRENKELKSKPAPANQPQSEKKNVEKDPEVKEALEYVKTAKKRDKLNEVKTFLQKNKDKFPFVLSQAEAEPVFLENILEAVGGEPQNEENLSKVVEAFNTNFHDAYNRFKEVEHEVPSEKSSNSDVENDIDKPGEENDDDIIDKMVNDKLKAKGLETPEDTSSNDTPAGDSDTPPSSIDSSASGMSGTPDVSKMSPAEAKEAIKTSVLKGL